MSIRDYNRAGPMADVEWIMHPYRNMRCRDCGAEFYMDFWGMGYSHFCEKALERIIKAKVDAAIDAAMQGEQQK